MYTIYIYINRKVTHYMYAHIMYKLFYINFYTYFINLYNIYVKVEHVFTWRKGKQA